MLFVPNRSATSSEPAIATRRQLLLRAIPVARTPNRTDRVEDCIELHFDFADVAECCFQHDSPHGRRGLAYLPLHHRDPFARRNSLAVRWDDEVAICPRAHGKVP